MGMDIYSEHGIVFRIDELFPRIFKKIDKKQLKSMSEEISKISGEVLEFKSASEFQSWFAEFIAKQHNGEYFEDTTKLELAWDVATTTLKLDLPRASFEYWTHARLQGYEVPIEEFCVVFDDSEVFENKLTSYGKKLAKLLGEKNLSSSTWTIMSV